MLHSETLHIRSAVLNDAYTIARIHVLGWQVSYRGHMPDDFLNNLSIEEREKQWSERIEKSLCQVLVAEIDHQVVGFIGFGSGRDEDIDPKTTAEIMAIYLLPECKKHGIGYQLMKRAIEVLKQEQYSNVILWVLSANQAARHFYEKLGFIYDKTKTDSEHDGIVLCDCRYRKVLE